MHNPESKRSYRVAIRGTAPGDNFCACADYATNELGTCKHIEFVLDRLSRKRGAKAAFRRGWHPPFSELYLRNDGERHVHFRAGADCPEALRHTASTLFDGAQDGRLDPSRFGALDAFMAQAAALGHELRAYDDALDFIAGHRDAARRVRVLDEAFPAGSADPALTGLLKVPLYPYQAEGALFAVRAGRSLIGDDMGLGKTIQAIAAAEILARHFGLTRVLVVCPTSLKYQWQSEIARFAGRDAMVIASGRRQRRIDYAADGFCKITNYEKLIRDLDLIAGWAPQLVIVDEAQRVKNWNTVAAQALKRIDSPYAVVLTGTPLENKLEELISIVQFVDQYRLGPTWRLLHQHQVKDETGRVTGYTGLDAIGETLAPILLRRRKSEVLHQLPVRTDQNLLVPMTEPQMALHEENAAIVQRIVTRWRNTGFLSEVDQRRLTCALQNMRMACNSTYLLDQETDHGVKADELVALLEDALDAPDAKAVVFSQWTRTQEILVRRLAARGIGHVCFHGGIASEKRPARVARFRDDPGCRVFLSSDAGATGLNLQHAAILINMDLPWNPALLEQRIARVHRMGQRRPVQIINFVAKGTIEESMLSVLAFKRSLSAGILDGGQAEVALGGSRLKRFMSEVDAVTGRQTSASPAHEDSPVPSDLTVKAGAGSQESAQQPSPAADEMPGDALSGAAADPAVAGRDVGTVAGSEHGSGGFGATASLGAVGEPNAGADPEGAQPGSTGGTLPASEPWAALAQLGAQLAAALSAPQDAAAAPVHPWVRRDPVSGQPHLSVPLPPPETARQLADAFAMLADTLRGRG